MPRRRDLLAGALIAPNLAAAQAADEPPAPEQHASIIDLDRCDGCADRALPACVAACRELNCERFPKPEKPLQNYWPQKKFEDFSEHPDRADRLTPYNWLYVEKIELPGKTVYAPRRCMQCFDAPCRKLCPFGAIDRTKEGAVVINPDVCFGGAKCRDACPWEIPQRQAGVGIYLKAAPKFAGGGVMFKCDFCAERLARGEAPACAAACPRGALIFGTLEAMKTKLEEVARGRFVYGRTENGGTATWYVSSVPFAELDSAIRASRQTKAANGRPGFQPETPKLTQSAWLAKATLAAPVAAVAAAVMLRKRKPAEGEGDAS